MMTITPPSELTVPRRGRMPATSREELERVALRLFSDQGFADVTVDDIARAAGVARRTVFRYFASKNDIPWGDFDALLSRFRADLDATGSGTSLIEAIRLAVQAFNAVPAAELPAHRRRMGILLRSPELVADSTARYAQWRAVIADFVARRRGLRADSPLPAAVSWACLGIALSAYDQWIASEDHSLPALIDESFDGLQEIFAPALSVDDGTT